MAIFNALLVTAFLLLLAASAAVVGSMILLALFDWAFGNNKNKLPIINEKTKQNTGRMGSNESGEPPSKPDVEVANSKPKPESLAA